MPRAWMNSTQHKTHWATGNSRCENFIEMPSYFTAEHFNKDTAWDFHYRINKEIHSYTKTPQLGMVLCTWNPRGWRWGILNSRLDWVTQLVQDQPEAHREILFQTKQKLPSKQNKTPPPNQGIPLLCLNASVLG